MTAPGQRPDTPPGVRTARGGIVRTTPAIGETTDCGALPTRADSVRTTSDNPRPDTPGGVRIEYRAQVPRHLAGAAFTEAFDLIARETRIPLEGPTDD